MDDIAVLERLVPAGEVLDLLAREHDRRSTYANFEVCRKVALETLLARLRDNHLDAWSTACGIDSTIDTGNFSPAQIISTWDFYSHSGFPKKIPMEFWAHFHYATENMRSFDEVANDFRFGYMDETYSKRDGYAYSVYFDPRGLPSGSIPSWHGSTQVAPLQPISELSPSIVAGKGRPRADWWPDFVAELVAYVKEIGLPEGIGHQGQGQVFKEVSDRLAAAGKSPPERTQTQETINAVLRRMRSAGKS